MTLLTTSSLSELREKMASSSMWVQCSHVNVVLKLQGSPRITTPAKELQH